MNFCLRKDYTGALLAVSTCLRYTHFHWRPIIKKDVCLSFSLYLTHTHRHTHTHHTHKHIKFFFTFFFFSLSFFHSFFLSLFSSFLFFSLSFSLTSSFLVFIYIFLSFFLSIFQFGQNNGNVSEARKGKDRVNKLTLAQDIFFNQPYLGGCKKDPCLI